MLSGRRSPLVEALLAKDPDRAFELAVKSAARGLGVAVDATEVRLAVAAVQLDHLLRYGESEADAVFEYVYEAANIGRPGGGMVMMERLLGATLYTLPAGLPEEKD